MKPPNQPVPRPKLPTLKTSRHRVKLLETDPLLVVEVHINGRGPFRFAVDTGASITVISSSTAREMHLRLPQAGTERAVSATGSTKVTLLKVHSLRIGKMEIKDLQVAIMDLLHLRRNAKLDLGGVIGRNLLARYRVTIDYRSSRIIFH